VCKLDANLTRREEAGVMDNTHTCTQTDCDRIAHFGFLSEVRKIHKMEVFKDMTCFEIVHSKVGREVWSYKGRSQVSGKAKSYSVNYGHPVVKELRRLHGLVPQQQRRKRNSCSQLFRWNDSHEDAYYNADAEDGGRSQDDTTRR